MRARLAGCAVVALSVWVRAQSPSAGGATAFENATVVVGDGRVLARATVVVRDGLIESVGAAASPAGSRIVDLAGSFLYPGLIDALTEQGLRQSAKDKPRDVPPGGVMADVRAADLLDADGQKLAAWRDAGVLALNVAPDSGIFMGQSAIVSLRAGAGAPSVVRAPVAMRMSLRPLAEHTEVGPLQYLGPQGFPSVPIGVIAHIKQTLVDAQHQLIAPVTSAALDALAPVVRRAMPLIIPAQEERHIRRVVDLSDQFSMRFIVAGGYEAPELAAELNQRKIPVLVSLNFPEERRDNPERRNRWRGPLPSPRTAKRGRARRGARAVCVLLRRAHQRRRVSAEPAADRRTRTLEGCGAARRDAGRRGNPRRRSAAGQHPGRKDRQPSGQRSRPVR